MKRKVMEKQFSVALTPKQKKKLAEESHKLGVGMAAIIRIALEEYFSRRKVTP